jgi:predicted secreted protein
MGWVSGIVVYLIVWWLVFFTVLPWGVTRRDEPVPGQDPGAPDRPLLWRKVLVTTLLAAVVWLVIFLIVSSNWLSFRVSPSDIG